jgi:hypothetical protein
MNLIGRDGWTDGRDGRTHAQTTLPAAKVTDKTHVLCFAVPTFPSVAHENEAPSTSFPKGMIPRCKPATHVGRFNYYAVKRGYKCGLFFNWLDCERQVKGYSGAQFKGF